MRRDSTPSAPFDGDIAEFAVWDNTHLDQAEIESLAAGYSPLLVRLPTWYVPLVRDADKDIVGGNSFTVGGTPTVSPHPRIIEEGSTRGIWITEAAPPVEGQPAIRRLGGVNHSIGYNLQGVRRW